MRVKAKTIYATTVKRSSAVTFIELILIITITVALLGLGLPRFRRTFNAFALQNAARQLLSFMNYLSQRAIIEKKIVTLTIDKEDYCYWAQVTDATNATKRIKTFTIPKEVRVTPPQIVILFYPDGTIDKVTVELSNEDNDKFSLTTEGTFGNVKIHTGE